MKLTIGRKGTNEQKVETKKGLLQDSKVQPIQTNKIADTERVQEKPQLQTKPKLSIQNALNNKPTIQANESTHKEQITVQRKEQGKKLQIGQDNLNKALADTANVLPKVAINRPISEPMRKVSDGSVVGTRVKTQVGHPPINAETSAERKERLNSQTLLEIKVSVLDESIKALNAKLEEAEEEIARLHEAEGVRSSNIEFLLREMEELKKDGPL